MKRQTTLITGGIVLMAAVMADAQQPGARIFEQLDADGDGQITRDEFSRHAPRLARQRGERGLRNAPAQAAPGASTDLEAEIERILDRKLKERAPRRGQRGGDAQGRAPMAGPGAKADRGKMDRPGRGRTDADRPGKDQPGRGWGRGMQSRGPAMRGGEAGPHGRRFHAMPMDKPTDDARRGQGRWGQGRHDGPPAWGRGQGEGRGRRGGGGGFGKGAPDGERGTRGFGRQGPRPHGPGAMLDGNRNGRIEGVELDRLIDRLKALRAKAGDEGLPLHAFHKAMTTGDKGSAQPERDKAGKPRPEDRPERDQMKGKPRDSDRQGDRPDRPRRQRDGRGPRGVEG